jgi:hypothetical protein
MLNCFIDGAPIQSDPAETSASNLISPRESDTETASHQFPVVASPLNPTPSGIIASNEIEFLVFDSQTQTDKMFVVSSNDDDCYAVRPSIFDDSFGFDLVCFKTPAPKRFVLDIDPVPPDPYTPLTSYSIQLPFYRDVEMLELV